MVITKWAITTAIAATHVIDCLLNSFQCKGAARLLCFFFCRSAHERENLRNNFSVGASSRPPWTVGVLKMQEHFSASRKPASMHSRAELAPTASVFFVIFVRSWCLFFSNLSSSQFYSRLKALLQIKSIPTQAAFNHGLGFSANPDFAFIIHSHLYKTIAAYFATLASGIGCTDFFQTLFLVH